jgi:hypothetical protein
VSQRPRRRSRDVALVAVPVLALAFGACGSDDDTAYCVDKNDRIVENRYCDDEAVRGNNGGGGAAIVPFFWYYGGGGGGRLAPGTRLTGGDRVAASNIAENARRGGYGSSSRPSASGVGRVAPHSSGGG